MINTKIQSVIYSVLSGFLLLVLPASTQASTSTPLPLTGDPNTTVCMALANIMPCGTATASKSTIAATTTTGPYGTTTTNTAQTRTSTGSPSFLTRLFGGGSTSSSARDMSANISQGFLGKTQKNFAVVLVKAPDHPEVYRIIGGKRFLVPDDTTFDSYGYVVSDLKTMSWTKVMSYPRVKLIKLDGDATIYYLTEGGMTRRILNQSVFDSYADSDQDVVVINKTEFSLYPQNIYIFNESTYTFGRKSNVYLIGNGTKKLFFPDELARQGVTDAMIAPVNQVEFDAYQSVLAISTQQKLWYQFF